MINLSLLRCNICGSELKKMTCFLRCVKCGNKYRIVDNIIDCLGREEKEIFTLGNVDDLKFQDEEMNNATVLAKIYSACSRVITCDFVPNNQLNDFLKFFDSKKTIVELGSGNRRLVKECINIDIFPFKNVNILADIKRTPLKDASVDLIVIEAVLEHVSEPQMVVNEIFRILKPGGKVFCVTPFIHPYHGYPKNFFNFSADGLMFLFRDFKECAIEIYRGPTSAIISLMSEYVALAFSKKVRGGGYIVVRGMALLPIFVFKFLDKFWNRKGSGIRLANALCTVVKK